MVDVIVTTCQDSNDFDATVMYDLRIDIDTEIFQLRMRILVKTYMCFNEIEYISSDDPDYLFFKFKKIKTEPEDVECAEELIYEIITHAIIETNNDIVLKEAIESETIKNIHKCYREIIRERKED